MLKIVRIPSKLKSFFRQLEMTGMLRASQADHVTAFILGLIATGCRRTVVGISRAIFGGVHRVKRNEFLTESQWDEAALQSWKAYRQLKRLGLKPGDTIHFILDDTHTKKRGKKMQGAGKYKDTATNGYVWGHNILAGVFYYQGFVVPYALRVHLKPEQARKLQEDFRTLPEAAAEIIRSLQFSDEIHVIVLFDSAYMNKKVVQAVKDRGWTYVSVLPANRNITIKGRKTKLGKYRRCIPHSEHRAVTIRNPRGHKKTYWATDRDARLPSIGQVKIVFSRRKKGEKALPIVTNDRRSSRRQIIQTYNIRWVIELFFKQTKQHLGLGEYQTTKYTGVVKHLHLVCLAYSLLVDRALEARERIKTRGNRKGALAVFSLMNLVEQTRGLIFEDLLDYLLEQSDPKQAIRELRRVFRVA